MEAPTKFSGGHPPCQIPIFSWTKFFKDVIILIHVLMTRFMTSFKL
jgi:hypothetical protein